MELKEGLMFEQSTIVTPDMSAIKVGSGLVDVLATPAMIAFVEKVCSEAIMPYLQPNEVSVGLEVNTRHVAASKIGSKITCKARINQIVKNRIAFSVAIYEGEKIIGMIGHIRCVVDKQKFLDKLK